MFAATIWQVSCAHAASAPSSRSPEQAAEPSPPTPACAPAAYRARPRSTLQAITLSPVLPVARSVIWAAFGSAL